MNSYVLAGIVILLLIVLVIFWRQNSPQPDSPKEDARQRRWSNSIEDLDAYLHHWNQFAQGKEGMDFVRQHNQEFYETVLVRLSEGDSTVVPRIVMYFFVQVFFFLPEESRLYPHLYRISNGELSAIQIEGKGKQLSSAEVWKWWKKDSSRFPPFPLLEEWLNSSYAHDTVIPQYERILEASH